MILELLGQGQVGHVVLGGDDEAAGVPVNPVDDPRPELAVDAGEALAAVVEQGVDQGAVGVARGGVDHQPHGLVHHDDVPVLVHHVQGDFLGQDLHRGGVGDAEGEHVPGLEAVVLLQGLAPPQDPALLQQLLGRRAGELRQHPG